MVVTGTGEADLGVSDSLGGSISICNKQQQQNSLNIRLQRLSCDAKL